MSYNFVWHYKFVYSSLLGGRFDPKHPKPVDGFDVWETISFGKPSPRNEVLINIDTTQGSALRVGQMKILLNVPNVTWFRPPELEKRVIDRETGLQLTEDDRNSELLLLVRLYFVFKLIEFGSCKI